MQVARFQAKGFEVIGEILGGPLGECGDQDPFAAFRMSADFLHDVIDLVFQGAHMDGWVDQAGWADKLGDGWRRGLSLEGARGG